MPGYAIARGPYLPSVSSGYQNNAAAQKDGQSSSFTDLQKAPEISATEQVAYSLINNRLRAAPSHSKQTDGQSSKFTDIQKTPEIMLQIMGYVRNRVPEDFRNARLTCPAMEQAGHTLIDRIVIRKSGDLQKALVSFGEKTNLNIKLVEAGLTTEDINLLSSSLKELSLYGESALTADELVSTLKNKNGLERLHINCSDQLTDAVLAQIGQMSCLKVLSLNGCTGFTSTGFTLMLSSLAKRNQLEDLVLLGINQLTDAVLAQAEKMSCLKVLILDSCTGFTSTGLELMLSKFAPSNQLERLEIMGDSSSLLTDRALALIGEMSDLKGLNLSADTKFIFANVRFTSTGFGFMLSQFAQSNRLEELIIDNVNKLPLLQQLVSLSISQ